MSNLEQVQKGFSQLDMDDEKRVVLIPVNPDPEIQQGGKRLIYTKCSSIDEWEQRFTETLKWARGMLGDNPERKEAGARVPIHCVVDSVTGADYLANTADIENEGHAAERELGEPRALGRGKRHEGARRDAMELRARAVKAVR